MFTLNALIMAENENEMKVKVIPSENVLMRGGSTVVAVLVRNFDLSVEAQ